MKEKSYNRKKYGKGKDYYFDDSDIIVNKNLKKIGIGKEIKERNIVMIIMIKNWTNKLNWAMIFNASILKYDSG